MLPAATALVRPETLQLVDQVSKQALETAAVTYVLYKIKVELAKSTSPQFIADECKKLRQFVTDHGDCGADIDEGARRMRRMVMRQHLLLLLRHLLLLRRLLVGIRLMGQLRNLRQPLLLPRRLEAPWPGGRAPDPGGQVAEPRGLAKRQSP